ncbi:uncharacterized protein K452DRAFT_300558 [Aplosporella prunicola CBS 121167]|uniref:Uncharacterized protein n=1 Tax=Aplosporella prunicola CBS 121167 TaxID=1176127 RepID=A0A6A6B4B4_9PEZI|nr:uncharacterized protein K452DRAFT_300558 [Aplosporella prunicola CBS 121167]KAF2138972.1 hypothetical protein K452DRAFT_300558 [Aplosporella prunicola CBS 121167]
MEEDETPDAKPLLALVVFNREDKTRRRTDVIEVAKTLTFPDFNKAIGRLALANNITAARGWQLQWPLRVLWDLDEESIDKEFERGEAGSLPATVFQAIIREDNFRSLLQMIEKRGGKDVIWVEAQKVHEAFDEVDRTNATIPRSQKTEQTASGRDGPNGTKSLQDSAYRQQTKQTPSINPQQQPSVPTPQPPKKDTRRNSRGHSLSPIKPKARANRTSGSRPSSATKLHRPKPTFPNLNPLIYGDDPADPRYTALTNYKFVTEPHPKGRPILRRWKRLDKHGEFSIIARAEEAEMKSRGVDYDAYMKRARERDAVARELSSMARVEDKVKLVGRWGYVHGEVEDRSTEGGDDEDGAGDEAASGTGTSATQAAEREVKNHVGLVARRRGNMPFLTDDDSSDDERTLPGQEVSPSVGALSRASLLGGKESKRKFSVEEDADRGRDSESGFQGERPRMLSL